MIAILIILLFFLMSFVGGERGFAAFLILALNIVVGIGSLYAITAGISLLIVMPISSLLFSFHTIVYPNGWNDKTKNSLLAIACVIFLSSILIYWICYRGHITGFSEIQLQDDNSGYLSAAVPFRMRHVLLLSLVWCQLGAISDTSLAVISALHEVHMHHKDFTQSQLFHEGMNIGKDILGTTINTLFFVSLAESILLLMYYQTYHYSLTRILNSSSFAQELFPILLPCIGCILIIPISAGLYTYHIKHQ